MQNNLLDILTKISKGNNLGEKITLVGATKTVPVEIINEAVKLGLEVVAENRVQEFREKTEFIDKSARQHFIGHLQTNKVKYLVGKVDLIHSVDSFHLAIEIDKQAKKINAVQDVLMEVNIGGELSKSGINPDNAIETAKEILSLNNVNLVGLMAMLPKSDDKEYLAKLTIKMRSLLDRLKLINENIKFLSMGMSGDYEIAISNGSNMIRLGSILFGKRNYEVK
ncbi:MAG: YggS family pyridoxal phosphate-dependent enzyme [Clostridia bacterium]|nr:YggS family pyridoxal phosphate-dependent enzyme [Clostridia bacterium]